MKVIYIADDGTKFDNEYDCERYEYGLSIKNNNIIFLDINREKLNVSDENLEQCCYMKISDLKDLDIVNRMGDYTGLYAIPNDIGEFYWDDSDTWYLIDDRIEELENELKSLKEAKEKLNG